VILCLRTRVCVPPPVFATIREYALLFWANRGNHNETTAQKFLPSFTFEQLQDAALKAQAAGAFASPSGDLAPLPDAGAVKNEVAALRQAIFDPAFEPTTLAREDRRIPERVREQRGALDAREQREG